MAKLNAYHLFVIALALIRSQSQETEERKKKKRRALLDLTFFGYRATSSVYQNLVIEMKEIDRKNPFGFIGMPPNQFDHLLELLKPIILKKNAVRAPIPGSV